MTSRRPSTLRSTILTWPPPSGGLGRRLTAMLRGSVVRHEASGRFESRCASLDLRASGATEQEAREALEECCWAWLLTHLKGGQLDGRLRDLGYRGTNGEAMSRTSGAQHEVTVTLLW